MFLDENSASSDVVQNPAAQSSSPAARRQCWPTSGASIDSSVANEGNSTGCRHGWDGNSDRRIVTASIRSVSGSVRRGKQCSLKSGWLEVDRDRRRQCPLLLQCSRVTGYRTDSTTGCTCSVHVHFWSGRRSWNHERYPQGTDQARRRFVLDIW